MSDRSHLFVFAAADDCNASTVYRIGFHTATCFRCNDSGCIAELRVRGSWELCEVERSGSQSGGECQEGGRVNRWLFRYHVYRCREKIDHCYRVSDLSWLAPGI